MCNPTMKEVLEKHGIKPAIRGYPDDGWSKIVDDMVTDLIALGWDKNLVQIKEKFSELRAYLHTTNDTLQARVSAAAEQSRKTCEFCGQPGTQHGKPFNWVKVSCDPCHVARIEEYKQTYGRDPVEEWEKFHGKDDSGTG